MGCPFNIRKPVYFGIAFIPYPHHITNQLKAFQVIVRKTGLAFERFRAAEGNTVLFRKTICFDADLQERTRRVTMEKRLE